MGLFLKNCCVIMFLGDVYMKGNVIIMKKLFEDDVAG